MANKKSMSVTFSPDEYTLSAEPVGARQSDAQQEQGRVVPQQTKRAPGRPPGRRTVGKDRGTGTTLYMTAEMKAQVKSCSFFADVDQGDIIRTAIGSFLRNYSHDGHLDAAGIALVQKQIADTTE